MKLVSKKRGAIKDNVKKHVGQKQTLILYTCFPYESHAGMPINMQKVFFKCHYSCYTIVKTVDILHLNVILGMHISM